jgi:arginyl-tRNA synthetase
MEKYHKKISEIITLSFPGLDVIFTTPPDSSHGDIALPCFAFAKTLRKNPAMIAEELKNKLSGLEFIEKIESSNGYLNFFIKKDILFKDIITDILYLKSAYGSSKSGIGKQALVEHTSINPNASPHLGRARNALIGDFIVRLLRFEGYSVDVHYFVNDIGKQIAMLLLGAMDKKSVSFQDLLGIYIDINNKVNENPELEKEVFDLLYRLENGDAKIQSMFRKLVNICIDGQTAILGELGIKYNAFDYESDYIYSKTTNKLLDEFKKTGKLEEDAEGRLVLNQAEYNLPMKAPYLVLTRKDKTSLYPLRDIAYTIDKVKANADMNIVVLGEDQKLYFRQICSALDLLGYKSPSSVHYSFVMLSEGKMATRKGNVVLLEDFMREATSKAYLEIEKRHGQADESTAKAIGYGAVKYAVLRASNDKSVIFDWESALSFEGDSGPYLQYSLARINSIFRNYGRALPKQVDFSVLQNNHEIDLVLELANFPAAVKTALKELSPHVIANYVYELTKKFSIFYHYNSVLNADSEKLKIARLTLITAVRQVILNCFELLGIEPVEEM